MAAVNLDPVTVQSGMVHLPLAGWEMEETEQFLVHDLLTDTRYIWQGSVNYIELDPSVLPGHIFRVRRHLRKEQDFDYFL